MSPREIFVAMLAETLAPRLFELCGKPPEEMGFPIYETREEVENHLAQQFDPVNYWTTKAVEIAEGLTSVFEAGSIDISVFDYASALEAIKAMRTDLVTP